MNKAEEDASLYKVHTTQAFWCKFRSLETTQKLNALVQGSVITLPFLEERSSGRRITRYMGVVNLMCAAVRSKILKVGHEDWHSYLYSGLHIHSMTCMLLHAYIWTHTCTYFFKESINKKNNKARHQWHTSLIQEFWRRQDLYEFEGSLVYRENSKTAKTTQKTLSWKTSIKQQQKEWINK